MRTYFQIKVAVIRRLFLFEGKARGDKGLLYVGDEEYTTIRRGDRQPGSLIELSINHKGEEMFFGLVIVQVHRKSYFHVVIE